jgi:hypothetical protein
MNPMALPRRRLSARRPAREIDEGWNVDDMHLPLSAHVPALNDDSDALTDFAGRVDF